jgi:transcriptional regulator with XRE-family HTH domain
MSTPSQDSKIDDALEAIAHRCDRCGIGDAPAIKRKGHTLARLCETCTEVLKPDMNDTDKRELIAFRKYRDKEWLREQHHDNELTRKEIAELCGCDKTTISNWLDRHDIETRLARPRTDPRLNDPEWLREQYHQKELSTRDIAELCDCSKTTVNNWLGEHNIETRSPGGASK